MSARECKRERKCNGNLDSNERIQANVTHSADSPISVRLTARRDAQQLERFGRRRAASGSSGDPRE